MCTLISFYILCTIDGQASTQEDVDAILDVPEYLEVINGSGWPCTQPISISNKSEIVQGLITEKVGRERVK